MNVRDAIAADRENIIALWNEAGLVRPWNDPAADFDRAMATPTASILAGFEGETLVATVMLGFDGHRGWIYYLATRADRRGKGHGRTIIETALSRLKDSGAPKVELMVREGNDAADFYERLGWERQNVTVFARWLNGDD